jgi:orotidine-5'-phosphate decarboxylase
VRPEQRIFVAIDTPDRERALELARRLAGRVGGFKVGLEAFVACGPPIVEEISALGHEVFLDLKLHDIPNTVAGAAAAASGLGASFLTVHALGGGAMIERAVASFPGACVLAVTILTSHDEASLARLGISGPVPAAVTRLASMARDAGAGGIVCSPLEIAEARRAHPEGTLVIPGIRPVGAAARGDDQARVATPAAAVAAGADRLVIGRPITQAEDPVAAAEQIAREIARG